MAIETKVTIGGEDYVIPALNFAQLQEVARIVKRASLGKEEDADAGMQIILVALRRAKPQPDLETLAPNLKTEIPAALNAIMEMSGLQQPDSNPRLMVVTPNN